MAHKNYTIKIVNDAAGMTLSVNGMAMDADLNSLDIICSRGGYRISLAEFTDELKSRADQLVGSTKGGGKSVAIPGLGQNGYGQYL